MCREVVSGGWHDVSDDNHGILWPFKPTFGISRPLLGAVSDASSGHLAVSPLVLPVLSCFEKPLRRCFMCREVVSGGWDHVSDSNQGVLWSCKPTFCISRPFLGAVSSEEKRS